MYHWSKWLNKIPEAGNDTQERACLSKNRGELKCFLGRVSPANLELLLSWVNYASLGQS